jgi:glutaredoxin 3
MMKKILTFLLASCIVSSNSQAVPVKEPPSSQTSLEDSIQHVAEKSVVIYTMEGCLFCQKAKKILEENGVAYQAIDIWSQPNLLAELEEKSGVGTVPQIYVNGEFFGGYKDLLFTDIFSDVKQKLLG